MMETYTHTHTRRLWITAITYISFIILIGQHYVRVCFFFWFFLHCHNKSLLTSYQLKMVIENMISHSIVFRSVCIFFNHCVNRARCATATRNHILLSLSTWYKNIDNNLLILFIIDVLLHIWDLSFIFFFIFHCISAATVACI